MRAYWLVTSLPHGCPIEVFGPRVTPRVTYEDALAEAAWRRRLGDREVEVSGPYYVRRND